MVHKELAKDHGDTRSTFLVAVEHLRQDQSKRGLIDTGQTQIHRGLLAGFVERYEHPCGLDLILGLQGREGFGGGVKSVIDAFATKEEAITQFHVHASSRLADNRFLRLGSSGAMRPNPKTILTEFQNC